MVPEIGGAIDRQTDGQKRRHAEVDDPPKKYKIV